RSWGVSKARRAIWSQCSTRCWRTPYASAKRSLVRFISTTETGSASAYYIMLEESYVARNPIIVSTVELAGFRTALAAPMLKDDKLIGCINIYRQEVR